MSARRDSWVAALPQNDPRWLILKRCRRPNSRGALVRLTVGTGADYSRFMVLRTATKIRRPRRSTRKTEQIPTPAIRRLSLYLRQLEVVLGSERRTVSSRQLGEALGLSDAQVRKDLAYFGQFGHPGIGYRVDELIQRVRRILGTDKNWNVLLVGAGNLGRALMSYRGFAKKGFHIAAVFDTDRELIGKRVDAAQKLTVQPMEEMAATIVKRSIQLGVLAVPADSAQKVADRMVEAGIRGILNFAPITLRQDVCAMAAVDLSVHLEQLSFQLRGAGA